MFCRKCGSPNDDNASKCANCGEPLRQVAPSVDIPNYLVQSILVTIFCCLPFGIPAIVFAAQVNGKLASGDLQGAMKASKQAKMWSWISFGCGLAFILIYVVLIIIGAVVSQQQPRG